MKTLKDRTCYLPDTVLQEQFSGSLNKVELLCEQYKEEIVSGFLHVFSEVVQKAKISQDKGQKGKIRYLLFSCLHSSIFMKTYWVRFSLMDSLFYNDGSETEAYWDAGRLYEFFLFDVKQIGEKVWGNGPRIREYEMDWIRYAYAPYYHRLAKMFIETMIGELSLEKNLSPFLEPERREEKMLVLFGEYMGRADILCSIGKGEGWSESI